jgi:hypothetical protein
LKHGSGFNYAENRLVRAFLPRSGRDRRVRGGSQSACQGFESLLRHRT